MSTPPLTTTTSIKPAATVLGIAVATLLLFTSVNLITNPRVATTTTIPIVVGALPVATDSTALSGCQLPGNPPQDVVDSLVVPVGTSPVGGPTWKGKGAGGFDCRLTLTTSSPTSDVLAFYKAHFVARGWKLFSEGAATKTGAQQLLFQRAGSDTFYWIAGLTVTSGSANVSTYSIRLYQGPGLV
jgi:hypothetical protein